MTTTPTLSRRKRGGRVVPCVSPAGENQLEVVRLMERGLEEPAHRLLECIYW